MEKKKQLTILGWAALLPLLILVWILSSEEPLPPGEKETVEDTQPEVAEKPAGLSLEDKEDSKTGSSRPALSPTWSIRRDAMIICR